MFSARSRILVESWTRTHRAKDTKAHFPTDVKVWSKPNLAPLGGNIVEVQSHTTTLAGHWLVLRGNRCIRLPTFPPPVVINFTFGGDDG